MDAPIVTELIQENCTTKQIKVELLKVLETKHREQLLANYDVLINKLGGIGASEKTAKFIVKELR
jgi:lipid-A-disaccharide synthase